jgi:hypothetical protein
MSPFPTMMKISVPQPLSLQAPGRNPIPLPAGEYVAIPATSVRQPNADPREFGLWPPSAAPGFTNSDKVVNVLLELSASGLAIKLLD